jgi:hypothetical protein
LAPIEKSTNEGDLSDIFSNSPTKEYVTVNGNDENEATSIVWDGETIKKPGNFTKR